jgi:TatD DNase family protein
MTIIDSHCHLDRIDLSEFGGSFESLLAQAKALSVEQFLCVCINLENFPKVLSLAKKYNQIHASVGVHPTERVGEEPSEQTLLTLAQDDNVVAIGETGLDYFHIDATTADWQRERFRRHINVAKEINKPLIIHTRDAKADTLRIMQEEQAHAGVMHCFVEDWESAKAALDLGFYISFSGIVTFKNAQDLQAVAKKIPIDRLLIETDSPYLTPMPYRGKPNMPGYTYYVAEKLAEIRQDTISNIAQQTTDNFHRLFKV